jgi:ceramide kinase
VENYTAFIIHYAKRKENAKSKNIWRYHSLKFRNSEQRIIKLWHKILDDSIKKQTYRPKRLLLFINPYGGKQKSMSIFEKYGKPLFAIANIDVNVVVSQRANQIRDFILTQSISSYDGIVCVGGDGTLSEVFNGILIRTMNDLNLNNQKPQYIPEPKIPIGVIPGGSTDTVTYCLHGTTDLQTSVIHIILGLTGGMDLASVSNSSGLLRFYASILSYGYLGDIALDSENFRWMGPKRYDYTGFKKFLANRGYDGEITFLLDEISNPIEQHRCLENCSRCSLAKQHDSSARNLNEDETKANDNNTMIDSINSKWKTIKGRYFMVNGANLSCSCTRSPSGFSPYCHVGDGYIDLILIKHTSFLNNIRLLLKLGGDSGSLTDLPFVEIYRTKQFCFRAMEKSDHDINNSVSSLTTSTQPLRLVTGQVSSNWNCDGEVLQESDVTVKAHCQLITVYRRGLKDNHEKNQCCF